MTTYHGPTAVPGSNPEEQFPSTAQVFLSYCVEDLIVRFNSDGTESSSAVPVVHALYQLMTDAGFVVRDCQQLPFPGTAEDIAISRSIESCDNLVVVLSPRSISHSLCLQGLLFALSMNKRIIPVLLATIDLEQLPTKLQQMPMIDLRAPAAPLAQSAAGQRLLHLLTQEAAYHQAHKRLLVQSLRWERQQRNPCLLMRGDCLHQYQQWLATARHHPHYPPIRVQSLFIETSQAYPQPLGWQAHLIYIPPDEAYACQISDLLQLFGKCTSFDHLNLLVEGNSRHQRRQTLEQAYSCICVLSPDSLTHEAYLNDLDYALSLHKQLVIISAASIAPQALPVGLNHCPRLVWPEPATQSAISFGKLFRLLEQNRDAAAYHTQLLQRALHWERQNRDGKLLLHRHLVSEAVAWLQNHPNPGPTALQRAYIEASQKSGSRWLGRH